jgi:hypothetical protein
MPQVPAKARLTVKVVKAAALGLFAVYLAWNAYWLWMGELPDSMLMGVAGVPCPTTGLMRSLAALARGEWARSLLWNPLALIYVALTAASACLLWRRALGGMRPSLPPALARLWAWALAAGWAAKLAIGPGYW